MPMEWASGHIDGAKHLPLGTLPTTMAAMDRSTPLALHCEGGTRSAIGAALLEQMGFTDVTDLTGGWNAWSGEREAGDEAVDSLRHPDLEGVMRKLLLIVAVALVGAAPLTAQIQSRPRAEISRQVAARRLAERRLAERRMEDRIADRRLAGRRQDIERIADQRLADKRFDGEDRRPTHRGGAESCAAPCTSRSCGRAG